MQIRTLALGLMVVAACGDDDSSDGAQFKLSSVAPAAEAAAGFTLTAQRVGGASGVLTVEVTTSDGSATAGADYTANVGELRWADGDTADKTITISILDDLAIEGAETLQGPLREAGAAEAVEATLTIEDDDRLGEMVALTTSGRLVSFDQGSTTVLRHAATPTGLPAGETILDLDYRPRDGKLYALSSGARLYTIDAATGAAAMVSALLADPGDASAPYVALVGTQFGLDFNPVVDRLRVVSEAGQNLRIDVDTGRTITDGTIRGAVTGLAAAGYVNNIAAACRTRLYGLDALTGRLLVQDPPNDGVTTVVGAGLGVTATAGLLDLSTAQSGTTSAFAVLTVSGASGLYSLDLTTGAATRVGGIGLASNETVRALAIRPPALTGPVPQAAGELYAITTTGGLMSFNRAAPAKPCTALTVSGVAAAETVVGLDVRPSTGLLYALVNNAGAGALYTIDPATGAAAGRVALSAPLVGAAFGVNFNPTGPVALRIVSDTGQNLRVTDLAAGTTLEDGALNGASTGASGAAYINSFPGAATTTLYTLDPTVDRLRIQNPPNAGTQVDVGALGVDATSIDGFDIDGRDNVAFVALSLAGSTSTTFHTVDLTTGAVSPSLGSFGARLRGVARPTPAAAPTVTTP